MSVFSQQELDYLAGRRLGRLATIGIGGRDFARTKKFRNVKANPKVALVIDDVLPPWRPRSVMVRGEAEALDDATGADGEHLGPIIRIHPSQVLSWGLDDAPAREPLTPAPVPGRRAPSAQPAPGKPGT